MTFIFIGISSGTHFPPSNFRPRPLPESDAERLKMSRYIRSTSASLLSETLYISTYTRRYTGGRTLPSRISDISVNAEHVSVRSGKDEAFTFYSFTKQIIWLSFTFKWTFSCLQFSMSTRLEMRHSSGEEGRERGIAGEVKWNIISLSINIHTANVFSQRSPRKSDVRKGKRKNLNEAKQKWLKPASRGTAWGRYSWSVGKVKPSK